MSKRLEDAKKLTDITNKCVEKLISSVDPRDYDKDREYFIQMCLTAPSAISAHIIDALSGTFGIEREFILKQLVDKVKLALKWVDHKKEK